LNVKKRNVPFSNNNLGKMVHEVTEMVN